MLPKGKRNPEKAEKTEGTMPASPNITGRTVLPKGVAEAAEREVNQ